MAFSTTATEFRTRYYIRLDTASTERQKDFDPLLSALISQTKARCVTIYRFDPGNSEFTAAAARSSIQPLIRDAGVSLTSAASGWLFRLTEPAQGLAETDERFERFPERLQFGVNIVLVVPFRSGEKLLGILVLGRSTNEEFEPEATELAQRTARLIGAVMERDELQQRLRERKVVERAKGILQHRNGLSEERAYLLLRNTSRRSGLPMFEIARDIIGPGAGAQGAK